MHKDFLGLRSTSDNFQTEGDKKFQCCLVYEKNQQNKSGCPVRHKWDCLKFYLSHYSMTQTRSVITSWKSPVTHKIVSLQQGTLTPTKSHITPLWHFFWSCRTVQ